LAVGRALDQLGHPAEAEAVAAVVRIGQRSARVLRSVGAAAAMAWLVWSLPTESAAPLVELLATKAAAFGARASLLVFPVVKYLSEVSSVIAADQEHIAAVETFLATLWAEAAGTFDQVSFTTSTPMDG
jgi:hypothetical protein